jgi:hypothetical protein
MPSATPLSGVGELGEIAEQAAALVGCQRGGRPAAGQPPGWGMMRGQARRSGLVMGFDTHRIAGGRACPTSTRLTHPIITNQTSPHFAEALGFVARGGRLVPREMAAAEAWKRRQARQ